MAVNVKFFQQVDRIRFTLVTEHESSSPLYLLQWATKLLRKYSTQCNDYRWNSVKHRVQVLKSNRSHRLKINTWRPKNTCIPFSTQLTYVHILVNFRVVNFPKFQRNIAIYKEKQIVLFICISSNESKSVIQDFASN